MNFNFFLFFLFCKSEKVAKENMYFLQPYVNSKGSSSVARFLNEFVIRSHGSKSQFIQLGYSSIDSVGGLLYKNKIEEDKFTVELSLSIASNNQHSPGKGMMVFISKTDDYDAGDFYGRDFNFEGLCVCVDTSSPKNPFVVAMAGNFSNLEENKLYKDKKYINLKNHNDFKIRIVQTHRLLQVYFVDGPHEMLVLSTKRNLIAKGSYLGVSASNKGMGNWQYLVKGIEFFNIKTVKNTTERGENAGSSKFIWFVFLIAVGLIGYYLYTIHVKNTAHKN